MRPFTAFLRSVLNLQALVIEGAHFEHRAGHAVIRVRRRAHAKPRCPQHGCVLGGRITSHLTRWRHLNLASTHLMLEAEQREGRCIKCGGRRMEAVPWASTRAKHTALFDR